MEQSDSLDWQQALSQTYSQVAAQLVDFIPQLIAALLLLLVGLLVALLVSHLARSLLRGADALLRKVSPALGRPSLAIRRHHGEWLAKTVFWLTMLFFIAASANALGLAVFSTWMAEFLSYLPKLLVGVLIILGGYLLAAAVRVMAYSAASSAGLSEAELLSRAAQAVTLFTALVVGIEQLGIQIQFVTQLLLVVAGVLLAGVALAFGLGAQQLIANIVGAQQLQKFCRLGDRLTIAGTDGVVIEISGAGLVLETEAGRTWVPAKLFLETVCTSTAQPAPRSD